jgi:hypothetical protein
VLVATAAAGAAVLLESVEGAVGRCKDFPASVSVTMDAIAMSPESQMRTCLGIVSR